MIAHWHIVALLIQFTLFILKYKLIYLTYLLEITCGSVPGSRECSVYLNSKNPGVSHHKQRYG